MRNAISAIKTSDRIQSTFARVPASGRRPGLHSPVEESQRADKLRLQVHPFFLKYALQVQPSNLRNDLRQPRCLFNRMATRHQDGHCASLAGHMPNEVYHQLAARPSCGSPR